MLRLSADASRRRPSSGFTLIEVLVVIIIIGLLSAIAVPVLLKQREKAVMASVKEDLHQTVSAMKAYVLETGQHPLGYGCWSVTACAPLRTRLEAEGLRLSPGNEIGTHWGGYPTFFVCIEHVGSDGQASAYRYHDTAAGGRYNGGGDTGGCYWTGVWIPSTPP